jgi:hypothetical protein
LLGGFTFSDLLFKSSIIYTSLAGGVLAYLFAASSFYALISSPDEPAARMETDGSPVWYSLTSERKTTVGLGSIGIILLAALAVYLDPPQIEFDPSGFAVILGAAFVLCLPFRPFLSAHKWRAASLLYFMTWTLIAPLAKGFSDAQLDPISPKIRVGSAVCEVILVGSENLLTACPASYVLIPRDKLLRPLRWNTDQSR